MSANTSIEWADHTFNPWIGCTKISPACDNCYAKAWDDRFIGAAGTSHWGVGAPRKRTSVANWGTPMRWNAKAQALGIRYRVFCASLADVFDNEVGTAWRADLFDLIEATPHLDWLLLTKRIGNVQPMMCEMAHARVWLDRQLAAGQLPRNVWIGATVVNQEEADRDIPKLLRVPARVRFLSMEPLLGSVDLGLMCENWRDDIVMDPETGARECCKKCDYTGIGNDIDWVIAGGESGPGARPMHPNWAKSLRDQCEAAGVPFLFKQWGEWRPAISWEHTPGEVSPADLGRFCSACNNTSELMRRVGKKAAGRHLDGRTWDEVPAC